MYTIIMYLYNGLYAGSILYCIPGHCSYCWGVIT